MGSIRVLSDALVNQIAAGEVIERPASVVKELLENALDAQAEQITVEITKGGTAKIVVTDDGCGMDEMDARLAFERHATSKIAKLDDLERVRSLGFRGEALASIASVAEVIVQTKTAQSIGGVRVEISGGKVMALTPAGCPVGTKMEISNLFFNTPARKKYLKSEQTEYRNVLDTVQDLALAHPGVSFRLVSNGRVVFDLLKTEKVQARIGGLFGKSISDEMVEVFYGGRDLQITGFVGKPHMARATRKYQYFIINGRPVQDNRLGYAVKEAYSTLIPTSQYPIFVLSITMDPTRLDVNVHPRKLEVRFADPQEVFRVVKASVTAALSREHQHMFTPTMLIRDRNLDMPAFLRKNSIQSVERKVTEMEETGAEYDASVMETPTLGFGYSTGANVGKPVSSIFGAFSGSVDPLGLSAASSDAINARKAYLLQKRAERMAAQGRVTEVGAMPSATPMAAFTQSYIEERPSAGLTPLAQIRNSYLVAEDDEGIVIIDQHAAHERVMLGKLRAAEDEREPLKQPLLTPLQLELDYREKAVLEENLELLSSLGFDLSAFGGNTYTLEAVPDFLMKEDAEEVIKGFVDDLLNERPPAEASRRHEHILHTLACHAAAKFGRRLSIYEQQALIRELLQTEGGSACAHGRPTMIRLSFSELEQKFGRKG